MSGNEKTTIEAESLSSCLSLNGVAGPGAMPLALITRFVRRKAVLFTIFFCSLCYTIVSLMKDVSTCVILAERTVNILSGPRLSVAKGLRRLPREHDLPGSKLAIETGEMLKNFRAIYTLIFQASFSSGDEIDSIKFRNFDSLIWHSDDDDATNASSKITTCRNSVQGMTHIVDDRGTVDTFGTWSIDPLRMCQ